MATRACSGRILSVLEGGYGVPCCTPRDDLFLPDPLSKEPAVTFLTVYIRSWINVIKRDLWNVLRST
jgi:hypothetical protein